MATVPIGSNPPNPPLINVTQDDPFTRARLKMEMAVARMEAGPDREDVLAALRTWKEAAEAIAKTSRMLRAARAQLGQILVQHRKIEADLIAQMENLE